MPITVITIATSMFTEDEQTILIVSSHKRLLLTPRRFLLCPIVYKKFHKLIRLLTIVIEIIRMLICVLPESSCICFIGSKSFRPSGVLSDIIFPPISIRTTNCPSSWIMSGTRFLAGTQVINRRYHSTNTGVLDSTENSSAIENITSRRCLSSQVTIFVVKSLRTILSFVKVLGEVGGCIRRTTF